jgi:hypothetical protein
VQDRQVQEKHNKTGTNNSPKEELPTVESEYAVDNPTAAVEWSSAKHPMARAISSPLVLLWTPTGEPYPSILAFIVLNLASWQ